MRYQFYTADVFTRQIFGGNQLAVFPDARGLDAALMQQVAREFNLSETVFVLPPDDPAHTRRLRIFTPATELPFAGHPTIGAAHILASIGAIPLHQQRTAIVFEEGVGPIPVTIVAHDGRPVAAQLTAAQRPAFGPPPPPISDLAAVLSLHESDLLEGDYRPQAVSCGVPFLFVPLRDRAALGRARVQGERWEQVVAPFWAPHLYLLTFDVAGGAQLRARMFAPAMGIAEDPATGAAATALGGYLGVRDSTADGTLRWIVEQGVEMGRPSQIEVLVDKTGGQIQAVHVGGSSVMVGEGSVDIPPDPVLC
ncbi:MAG TPA: PhzF family phenazine biosynthesis protein [Roseiflexaceae bacterium]